MDGALKDMVENRNMKQSDAGGTQSCSGIIE